MDRWVTVCRSAPCAITACMRSQRPAEVAETLVSTKFQSTTTRGFANPDSPTVAVCLRPGTEIAFEADARTDGFLFRRSVHARLARFAR